MTRSILRNSSSNGWMVQKFGGTSIAKFPEKIVDGIIRATLRQNKVAVVCSARSAGKKVNGTTSRLLEVYKKLQNVAAAAGVYVVQDELVEEAKALVQDICHDHLFAVETCLRNLDLKKALSNDIQSICQELVEYLLAVRRFNLQINSRAKDRVISFGEKLSCRLMTYMLRERHVDAQYVDLTDVINHNNRSRGHLDASFYEDAVAVLRKKILACEDRVPIITGFFGNVPGSLIDGHVGRRYTDLCAALIAVAMNADELQLWKEVDGFFTADPTKVPSARVLPSITPLEAAELSFYGSEVVHYLTIDQVMKATPPIPIRIKNVNNPAGEGTIILPNPDIAVTPKLSRQSRLCETWLRCYSPRRPTAMTMKDKISVINVHSNQRSIAHGFLARVFAILDKNQISVDLISTSQVHVSMAIHLSEYNVTNFSTALQELEAYGKVSVLHDMAILSLVGVDMKNMIGMAGQMFSTLGEHNVNIEMISQGASEINISCVIDAQEATRAMNVLHASLFTFPI